MLVRAVVIANAKDGWRVSDTPPLTPADCDLRDFGWMPLEVARLWDSDFVVLASGDAFRAAVLLWCASWHQVPSASLPNDNRLLASLAGYGRDLVGWNAVRNDALRGFVLCSDGRFYHPVVAEKAIEADSQRKKQRKRTEAATAARRNEQRDEDRNGPRNVERNDVQQTGPEQTGQDRTCVSRSISSDRPASKPCRFDEFWQAYPRREGPNPRKPAELRFDALVKTGLDPDFLIAEVKKYAALDDTRRRVGTRYIPRASTWLNEQRWSDHAAVAALSSIEAAPMSIDDAVKQYAKFRRWPRGVGPEPGLTGCKASAELLAAHGLRPDGGKMSLAPLALPDEPLEAA